MKKALFSLIVFVGLLYACKNPVENVDVGLKTALPTSVELRFKPQSGALPTFLNIEISGPDADRVVSTLNTKNFAIDEDGLLNLALLAGSAPSDKQPLRFTVVATTDKFLKVVHPVELTDESLRTVPITLLSNQGGAPVVQATGQSNAAGTMTNTVTIQTPSASNVMQAAVTIPQGTQLKDVTGEPVDGRVTLTMLPVGANATADLPNGGILNNATTATGDAIDAQRLSSLAGAVTLEIYNEDNQTVKTFSKPISITFKVDPKTINPTTGEAIKVGDLIPLFSYNAATDRWQQEQTAKIEKNAAGGLQCVAAAPHLSTWAAGYTNKICSTGLTFKVKSNFSDYDVPFYCQAVYVDKNGRDLSVASSFYASLVDNTDIVVNNLNQNQSVRLKVYENPNDLTKFVASQTVESCGKDKANLDVRSFKIPAKATSVNFTIQFPCKNVDEKKLPEQVTAQFRPTGTSTWQDLITMGRKDIKGNLLQGKTYKVTPNKRYDLRVKVLGYNLEQPNFLVDQNTWLIKIKTDEFCKK